MKSKARARAKLRPTAERMVTRAARARVAVVPVQPAPSARPAQTTSGKSKRSRERKSDPRVVERDRNYDAKRGQHRQPALTLELATDVSKLLMSGVPFVSVLALCDPDYYAYIVGMSDRERGDNMLRRWALTWQRDPLLLQANSAVNGGEWQDLDPERRLQVAIDKHMAELAYFLYSHNYDALVGKDVDKADNARGAIMDFLAAKGGDPDAPWMKHLKDLVEKVGLDNAVPMLTAPTVETSTGKRES